jgi:hypothetical protein
MRGVDVGENRVTRRRALALAAGTGAAFEMLGVTEIAAAASSGASVIMLIRHAEKPTGSGAPHGVDANGNHDKESLVVQGWQRAGALVELFDPAVGKLRSGLTRPTALFASNPGSSGSKRPLETITPLAERLKMTVSTPVKDSETKQIAEILNATPGAPLAAWQHQDIPSIAGHLKHVHPKPPTKWPGDRFDIVWVFTRQSDGSLKFTQVPQLLLAGDKHSVIK